MIPFTNHSRNGKTRDKKPTSGYQGLEKGKVCLQTGMAEFDVERSDGTVLYIDCGGSYMTMYICQSSQTYLQAKIGKFYYM